MKTITVRGLDENTYRKLKEEARQSGRSMNRLVVETLSEDFTRHDEAPIEYHDLDELFGSWSQEEYEAITQSVDRNRQIDSELWK